MLLAFCLACFIQQYGNPLSQKLGTRHVITVIFIAAFVSANCNGPGELLTLRLSNRLIAKLWTGIADYPLPVWIFLFKICYILFIYL